MALFLSTFVNKIDKKGRVSVPATFRAALSTQTFQGIFCYRAFTVDAIEGCGSDIMEALAATVNPLNPFDAEENPNALILGDTRELSWDSEGRVVLPEDLIAHAHLSETAAFYGMGPKFQIWEPERLRAATEDMRKRALQARRGGGAA